MNRKLIVLALALAVVGVILLAFGQFGQDSLFL